MINFTAKWKWTRTHHIKKSSTSGNHENIPHQFPTAYSGKLKCYEVTNIPVHNSQDHIYIWAGRVSLPSSPLHQGLQSIDEGLLLCRTMELLEEETPLSRIANVGTNHTTRSSTLLLGPLSGRQGEGRVPPSALCSWTAWGRGTVVGVTEEVSTVN